MTSHELNIVPLFPLVNIAVIDPISNQTQKIVFNYSETVCSYIYKITSYICEYAFNNGFTYPEELISECLSNFSHAQTTEALVSINQKGGVIQFLDQGRGIKDLSQALKIGYSTTNHKEIPYIRGLGLGLPLIKKLAHENKIDLDIKSKPKKGTRIILQKTKPPINNSLKAGVTPRPLSEVSDIINTPHYYLNVRQREILHIIKQAAEIGPTKISELLGIPLSTAYRDLKYLEECSLIISNKGKRTATASGLRII